MLGFYEITFYPVGIRILVCSAHWGWGVCRPHSFPEKKGGEVCVRVCIVCTRLLECTSVFLYVCVQVCVYLHVYLRVHVYLRLSVPVITRVSMCIFVHVPCVCALAGALCGGGIPRRGRVSGATSYCSAVPSHSQCELENCSPCS